MAQSDGLTVAKIVEATRLLERHQSADGWRMSPSEYQEILTAAWKLGFLDYWEAWRLLYNAGFCHIVLRA